MGKKKRASRQNADTGASRAKSRGISRTLVIAFVLLLAFIPFLTAIDNDFAYDDNTQILQDTFIRSISNLPRALVTEAWYWRAQQDQDPNKQAKPTTPYYRPVFTIYLMAGWALFHDIPQAWHVANIALHLLVVLLIFIVVERFSGDRNLAAISAILFAIHPLRSESVAWISGLTDLILAILLLSSFYLYLTYREGGAKLRLAASLGCYLLGVFSKEPAVTFPALIAGYEFFIRNQDVPWRVRLKRTAIYSSPFGLLMAFYFLMRRYSLGFWLNDANYRHYSLGNILITIPLVVCKYIGLLLWPASLSIYHETELVRSPLAAGFILPFLVLLALGLLARPAWKSPLGRLAILWFLINLLPVLNLSAFDVFFLVQERYVYVPSIGFSVLLALAITKTPWEKVVPALSRAATQAVVLILIGLALTARTLAQNTVWKDDMTLFTHGAATASDQSMAHFILGHQYIKRQRYDQAIPELEKCVELNPLNKIAITNLATAHLLEYERTKDMAHIDRATALAKQGLALDDQQPLLWDIMGHALVYNTSRKNYELALAYFGRALQLQPNNPAILGHTGATYLEIGNSALAIRFLEQARQIDPQVPNTYKFLAYAYQAVGRTKEAADCLAFYLSSSPNAVDAEQEQKHLDALKSALNPPAPAPTPGQG